MLRVLVVDDEMFVRQMLIRCINWENLGLTIVGEAQDAYDGMMLVREKDPDIIFTDIRMPRMTGLEFAKNILEEFPEKQVVIVSGYDDFEYAREGIKIGIFDYLLKPINREELTDVAVRVRDEVLNDRQHKQEYNLYKEKLQKNAEFIVENNLGFLLTSSSAEDIKDELQYFGIHLQADICQVALVKAISDEPGNIEKNMILQLQSRDLIEQFFANAEGIYVFDSKVSSVAILNMNQSLDLYALCESLKKKLMRSITAGIVIGLGNRYASLDMIRASFQEAFNALDYRYTAGDNQVIQYRDIYPYSEIVTGIDEKMILDLTRNLKSGMMSEAMEVLTQLFENLRTRMASKDTALMIAFKIGMEICIVAVEMKLTVEEMGKDSGTLISGLLDLDNLDACYVYLRKEISNLSKAVMKHNGDKDRNIVGNVIDYIEEHYADPELTLAGIAKDIYTNSSYLSRIFKEKTGTTFSGYVFEIRMKKAVELVKATNLRSYEIAEKVGIEDPHYFSTCFKKYTGKSVKEYKNTSETYLDDRK